MHYSIRFGRMGLQYVLILLIVIVIVLLLHASSEGFSPRKIGSVDETTKQTDIDPTVKNAPNNTQETLWKNIDEMKQIAAQRNYVVSDWGSHLNLIINRVGCNFSILDTTTNTWIPITISRKTRSVKMRCTRMRRNRRCFPFVVYNSSPYSTLSQNVSYATSYKIDIEDYRTLMDQIINEYNIRSDAELQQSINFSNSEGFQPQYSQIEGMQDKPIDQQYILSKNNKKIVALQKSVDFILNNNYEVTDTQFASIMKDYSSTGKTNADIKNYVSAMKQFGVNSETDAIVLKQFMKTRLNTDIATIKFESLIYDYFPSYGITSVADIVVLQSGATGPFTSTVERHGLQNRQLFPSNQNKDNCVMEKLKRIHSTTIPTIGKNSQNYYYMNDFFDAFSSHNVNSQLFFDKIYSLYAELFIQTSIKPIADTLYYVKTFGPDMVTAFSNMKQILREMSLQSLNDYVSFTDAIKTRITMSSLPDATVLVKIWKDFLRYYKEVAYDKDAKLDNPVTVTTFSTVLAEIENSKPYSSPYFNVTVIEFQPYFEILYKKKYTMEALKRDIQLGSTCKRFLETANTNRESFASMDNSSADFGWFSQIKNWIGGFFFATADKEGMSISDSALLSSFGITDFTDELGKLETKLLQLDINSLNRKVDTITNMMNFVRVMVENGIVNRDMDILIDVMKKFGVINVVEWVDALETLKRINIKGVENVKVFLQKITEFGVVFGDKFKRFIDNIQKFGADFSSGPTIALGAFIDDMIRFGFTYHTPVKMNTTDTVISYLIKAGITMNTYTLRRVQIAGCKPLNTDNFPSVFLNSLYNYGKTSGTPYPNDMYDVQNPRLIESIQSCDILELMQQAHMVMNRIDQLNGYDAVLQPNLINIISFFYKEELNEIKKESDFYASVDNRVAMMNGVSIGMGKYAEILRNTDPANSEQYISIAIFLATFPALSFQYFSNEILSSCVNGKCRFDDYVDPRNTTCKASTKDPTINYREDTPVIPR